MPKISEETPDPIKLILKGIDRHPRTFGPHRAAFEKLMNDRRMQEVYGQFLRRDRQTGEFYYRPQNPKAGHTPEEAQVTAIREILQLSISAAADKIAVSKYEQIEAAKQRWLDEAKRLRLLANDVELAAELGLLGVDDPASVALASEHIEVARRFANWLEHLTSGLRRSDDPLVVARISGDPVVRGVQTMIAVKLKEQFGRRCDGIAAILTSVVLGAETTPRVSRAALTRKKTR